jgi:type VI secretion system secreted protein VgrG
MSTSDLITITSSAFPEGSRVAAFRAVEALSRPYQVEVFLAIKGSSELELDGAIGSKALLTIDRQNDRLVPFHFAGILGSVELLHEVDDRAYVRAVIVPKLWQLGLSRHSRIFTKQSVPDVLKTILEDNGISGDDVELRLGSYPKEEHICQYRESDLDFISRWMEREGIFYFFEHGDAGEKLVLCDSKSYVDDPQGTAVRYHPQTGADGSAGASLRAFRCRHSTIPTLVKLKDYDYAKPSLDVSGSSKVSDAGAGEIVLYGERFFSPGDGKRLAKLRAEELLAREVTYVAGGTRFHLRPGYVFELEDHPRDAFNERYLTTGATHFGNQAAGDPFFKSFVELPHADTYYVEVEAIPAKTQFRAACVTPWPRIYGYENASIDGMAESEYAQIDDQGRYGVKFKFDESDLKGGNASTFVRMMQPHGGGIEGFHFPLRKGTEVVIAFLGGDPDRPVISGVVPNTLTPSPVTSGNHTKNVIQTGGRNRLEIEDQDGQQRVTLSTPYSNTYLRMGSPNDGHELIVFTEDNTWLNAGKNLFIDAGITHGGFCQVRVKDKYHTFVKDGDYALMVENNKFLTHVKGEIEFHTTEGNYELYVDAKNYFCKVPAGSHKTETKGTTRSRSPTTTRSSTRRPAPPPTRARRRRRCSRRTPRSTCSPSRTSPSTARAATS